MANSLISMIKGNSTLIDNTEVLDGQVLFNTDTKTILLDDNNTREEYGGGDESNKNLAIIEEGEVATRGYAKGTYIIWQEQLYKVLSQINSGDSFVVNQNISEDTVGQELTQVQSNLTASDNLEFKFGKDTTSGKYGYYDLNGTFVPFKEAHTGTYIATARSASLDMGENHTYRYVNTNSVPNSNSGTYGTVTSNGTHDMGATNSYRYVAVSVVPSVLEANGVSNSNQISVVNGGYYFVQIFEADYYSITFYVDGGTILNRSGKHSSMDSGKGGASELFYIRATSNTLLIHDGDHKVSGIYTTNYMRVG